MLPRIPNQNGAARIALRQFGGLDRRAGAGNGAICAMENLTGTKAPLLASRPGRRTVRALGAAPHGLFAAGALFDCEGTVLRADGAAAAAVSDTDKVFAALGRRVVVFPDKLLLTPTGDPAAPWDAVPLEAAYTAADLVFSDGTYAGEPAEKNTVATAGAPFPFRAGDAVTFPPCAPTGGEEKTAVVREVDGGGTVLRFYENTFAETGTVSAALTLRRRVPDLDFLCACDNRVWGCRGDTVCCCKPGDPFNWNVFDGLSTDAWSAETGTAGDFTGCVSFMGYPVFFKEDRVFKVYGSRPSNYELMGSAALGVLPGAAGTVAAAGETLYYLSRAGFVRYGGGWPAAIDAALDARYTGGAAGSDGRRWFVSALRADGARELLVFDPAQGLWHREDALAVHAFALHGGTLYAQTDTALLAVGDAGAGDEGPFTASAAFADFDLRSFEGKYPVRLRLRLACAGPVTVSLRCDGGAWETAATLAAGDGDRYIPLPVRRCARFALRLSGACAWTLRALEIETCAGRTRQGTADHE